MSKDEFKRDIERALGDRSQTVVNAGGRLDEHQATGNMNRSDFSLTRKTVEAYNSADWSLEQPELLDRLVDQFSAIADAVDDQGPATKEQSDEAHKIIQKIAMIIG